MRLVYVWVTGPCEGAGRRYLRSELAREARAAEGADGSPGVPCTRETNCWAACDLTRGLSVDPMVLDSSSRSVHSPPPDRMPRGCGWARPSGASGCLWVGTGCLWARTGWPEETGGLPVEADGIARGCERRPVDADGPCGEARDGADRSCPRSEPVRGTPQRTREVPPAAEPREVPLQRSRARCPSLRNCARRPVTNLCEAPRSGPARESGATSPTRAKRPIGR